MIITASCTSITLDSTLLSTSNISVLLKISYQCGTPVEKVIATTAAMVSTDAHTAYFGLMGAIPGTSVTALSTMTNMIVVGLAPVDTNYKIYYNDATGAANSIDLGANFPKGTSPQAWLNITLYSPRSGGVHYRVVNRTNGSVASGFINTDVPPPGTILRSVLWTANGATGTASSFDFVQVKHETYP